MSPSSSAAGSATERTRPGFTSSPGIVENGPLRGSTFTPSRLLLPAVVSLLDSYESYASPATSRPCPSRWRREIARTPARSAAGRRNLNLLPFEVVSDLNNNGRIDDGDRALKRAAGAEGATEEDIEKATEYMFVNDKISNGTWDKEDPKKPSGHLDDDDAEEIRVICAATWGAVWFEHPAIERMVFYKSKECKPDEKVEFPFELSTDENGRLPESLFVRVEEQLGFDGQGNITGLLDGQAEGELVMKFGKVDKSEVWAEDRINLTVVRHFGDSKFFHAARDYIMENNTAVFVHEKKYASSTSQLRICVMREEATLMFPIETYHRANPLPGMQAVVDAYPGLLTVLINGNQCFFEDGSKETMSFVIKRALTGGKRMSERCHGRLVIQGVLSPASSDNYDTTTTPAPGSHLAAPDPVPGISPPSRGGRYIAQNGEEFVFGSGVVPHPAFSSAMGGLSTNYDSPFRQNSPHMWVGRAPVLEEGKGVVFTANHMSGGGMGQRFADDAKESGVPTLPGASVPSDLQLFILDSGQGSVALAHIDPSGDIKIVRKGRKQNGVPFFVNTYLGFYATPPRQE